MYIVVVGGGRVGYYLTITLLEEGHEVLIVEKNTTISDGIVAELGSVCVHGDGCEASTLAEVGTGRADMFVAVTGDDEDNLVACQVAKHKFNVSRTIARVRNPQNEAIFKKLGVDVTISSTNIIIEAIEREVPTHPLTHLLALKEEGPGLVEVRVPPESTSIGKPVKELPIPEGTKLALLLRKEGKPLIPTANTIIQAGDQIIAVTTPESEEELRTALRGG